MCGLRCKYCFYEDVANKRLVKNMGFMQEAVAERIIAEAVNAVDGGVVSFMFQGGEPTLAGLGFFKRFIELEKKHAKRGVRFDHSIQTNGMAIDREWAEFLRKNTFLVGISIDGNEYIHDSVRVDANGSGTWKRAVSALKLLDEHKIETNILCVVTKSAAKHPQQVYRALRALGNHSMQFIACLDPLGAERGTMEYSLSPEMYGKFLCGVFDCWYRDWKNGNYVTVRDFEDRLRHLLRMAPVSCSAAGNCGHYPVIEADGSIYPCDFFVLDEYCLGNILETGIEKAMTSEAAVRFFNEGAKRPAKCASCRWVPICRGGCRRDFTDGGENYFCDSYRTFFSYAIYRLEEMAAAFVSGNLF